MFPTTAQGLSPPAFEQHSSFAVSHVDAADETSRHVATCVSAVEVTSRADSGGEFLQRQSPHAATAGCVGSIHGSPVMGRINGSTSNYVGRPECKVIGSLRLRRAFDLDRCERNSISILQHLIGRARLPVDANQVTVGGSGLHSLLEQLRDGRSISDFDVISEPSAIVVNEQNLHFISSEV